MTKENLRKIAFRTHYEIFDVTNPDYSNQLSNSRELTQSEFDCIQTVIDSDMPIREQMSFTREVFGKPAFIYAVL